MMQASKNENVNAVAQTLWRLDESHTTVEFTAKKLFFLTVKGRIRQLEGTILLDENDLARSSVEVTLRAASIDTSNSQRDAQLKGSSFLDVAKNPEIGFASHEVGPGRDRDTIRVKGTLTIKNRTNDVLLEVTEVDRSRSPNGEEVIYYVATTELDRFSFGVSGLRGFVSRKLKVVINVQANRC